MIDGQNPFEVMAKRAQMRERQVDNYTQFLIQRVCDLKKLPPAPEAFTEDDIPWLMDRISDIEDKEEISADDAARLSSLYYYLLTTSEVGP